MFTIIVPTQELKSQYEAGDYGTLPQYYAFDQLVEIVLSAEHYGKNYQPLQDAFPFTGDEAQWFEMANVIVLTAEIFAEDLRVAILDALENFPLRYYYGFNRFVHAGIAVDVSDHQEPGLPFDTAEELTPSNDQYFDVPQFQRNKAEMFAQSILDGINIGRGNRSSIYYVDGVWDDASIQEHSHERATGTSDLAGLSY